ncbi:hypothetical protein QCA50_008931 [Cerrena zonata]|uniref:Uncharacterized protein n=1 Tax=Cerrena zonata TaxID=2478898 RepID=A0AAW0GFD0_9APHY
MIGSLFKSVYDWMSAPDPASRPPYDPFSEGGFANIIIPLPLNNTVAFASVSASCGRKKKERSIPLKDIFTEPKDDAPQLQGHHRRSSIDQVLSRDLTAKCPPLDGVCRNVIAEAIPARPRSPMTNLADTSIGLSTSAASEQTLQSIQNSSYVTAVL